MLPWAAQALGRVSMITSLAIVRKLYVKTVSRSQRWSRSMITGVTVVDCLRTAVTSSSRLCARHSRLAHDHVQLAQRKIERFKRTTYTAASLVKADAPIVQKCTLDDWQTELNGSAGSQGTVVALGKFDAMHKGHRALAAKAAEAGAQPWLLSFSGMAEVLGWAERPPLVADCDRVRVLASWATACGGRAPCQRLIPFSAVRAMSPEDFVRVLALDLKVSGVAVGEGFRFGYKAAGDTRALLSLGEKYGLGVSVVDLVASAGALKVSSSAVRSALEAGQVGLIRQLLCRRHRLVVQMQGGSRRAGQRLLLERSCFLNQQPGEGPYSADVILRTPDGHQSLAQEMGVEIRPEGLQLHCAMSGEALEAAAQLFIDF